MDAIHIKMNTSRSFKNTTGSTVRSRTPSFVAEVKRLATQSARRSLDYRASICTFRLDLVGAVLCARVNTPQSAPLMTVRGFTWRTNSAT